MKLYHTIFYYATDFIAVMQENPAQVEQNDLAQEFAQYEQR